MKAVVPLFVPHLEIGDLKLFWCNNSLFFCQSGMSGNNDRSGQQSSQAKQADNPSKIGSIQSKSKNDRECSLADFAIGKVCEVFEDLDRSLTSGSHTIQNEMCRVATPKLSFTLPALQTDVSRTSFESHPSPMLAFRLPRISLQNPEPILSSLSPIDDTQQQVTSNATSTHADAKSCTAAHARAGNPPPVTGNISRLPSDLSTTATHSASNDLDEHRAAAARVPSPPSDAHDAALPRTRSDPGTDSAARRVRFAAQTKDTPPGPAPAAPAASKSYASRMVRAVARAISRVFRRAPRRPPLPPAGAAPAPGADDGGPGELRPQRPAGARDGPPPRPAGARSGK
jgi:hypothetical protein